MRKSINTAIKEARIRIRDQVLVRSCGTAGVATGDGRHQLIQAGWRIPDLDEGSALRCASVLRTPSAPAGKGRCAPTGNDKSCPSSIGPNRPFGRLWTPHASPYFAWGTPPAPSRNQDSGRFPGFAARPSSCSRDQGLRPWTSRRSEVQPGSPAPPPVLPFALRPKGKSLWKPKRTNQHQQIIWNSM